MRIAITLPTDTAAVAMSTARTAEDEGLDLVVVPDHDTPDGAPIPLAAAVAASTSTVAIGVEVLLGHHHPLYAAEEVAVLDRVARGRTVVIARPHPAGTAATFAEALDVVRAAWSSRPFRSPGPTWPIPGDLPANRATPGGVRVMPAPTQLTVPVWVDGDRELADRHGLAWIATYDAEAGPVGRTEGSRDVATHGLRPGWVRPPTGGDWSRELIERLRGWSRRDGLDVALVRTDAPPSRELLVELGGRIRAAVQLDHLPEGLVATWDLGDDLDPHA